MDISFVPMEGHLCDSNHLRKFGQLSIAPPQRGQSSLLIRLAQASMNIGHPIAVRPLTERMTYAIRRLQDGQVVGMWTYFTTMAKHDGGGNRGNILAAGCAGGLRQPGNENADA